MRERGGGGGGGTVPQQRSFPFLIKESMCFFMARSQNSDVTISFVMSARLSVRVSYWIDIYEI